MPEMPDTIYERMGKSEQEIHTLTHRVGQLEGLPPRVSQLEQEFSVMNSILTDIRNDNMQIKSSLDTVKSSQDKMTGAIDSIPRYIKVTTFIIFVASLAAVAGVWAQ